jgi:hypothetical protein
MRAQRPRRPWYLSLSLVLACLVGLGSALTSGYTLSRFQMTPGEISLDVDRQPDLTDTERANLKAAFESYTLALRAAKSRAFPLTVAQLLLGIAMIFFAHGASVGWAWARHALVQLLIAGIVLSGVAWVLTPDLRGPLDALQLASARLDPSEIDPTTLKAANITVLVFGMFVSAVTLLGLTLRRSRAFYEPATGLDEL